MALSVTNVACGPAILEVGGTTIGHTNGGINFSYAPDTFDLTVDQYGTTPVGVAISGKQVMVTTNMAEYTLTALATAMSQTVVSGNRINLGGNGGTLLTPVSVKITPLDGTETIFLRQAVALDTVETPFAADGQRVFQVSFKAIIDDSQNAGSELGWIS